MKASNDVQGCVFRQAITLAQGCQRIVAEAMPYLHAFDVLLSKDPHKSSLAAPV